DAVLIRDEISDGRILEQRAVPETLHVDEGAAGRELLGLHTERLFGDAQLLMGDEQLLEESTALSAQRRLVVDGTDLSRQALTGVTDAPTPRVDCWLGRNFPVAQHWRDLPYGQSGHPGTGIES